MLSRALASVYLYRSPGVPLVIYADQRSEYLDTLESADAGDYAPFTTFVEQRVIDTIGMVRVSVRNATPASMSVAAIAAQLSSENLDIELVAAVERLRSMLVNEYRKQLVDLELPPQLQVDPVLLRHQRLPAPPNGFAEVGQAGDLFLWARSEWPRKLQVHGPIRILVRSELSGMSDILIHPEDGESLEVWRREVSPSLAESLKYRLSAWVKGHIDTFMEAVASAAEHAPRVE